MRNGIGCVGSLLAITLAASARAQTGDEFVQKIEGATDAVVAAAKSDPTTAPGGAALRGKELDFAKDLAAQIEAFRGNVKSLNGLLPASSAFVTKYGQNMTIPLNALRDYSSEVAKPDATAATYYVQATLGLVGVAMDEMNLLLLDGAPPAKVRIRVYALLASADRLAQALDGELKEATVSGISNLRPTFDQLLNNPPTPLVRRPGTGDPGAGIPADPPVRTPVVERLPAVLRIAAIAAAEPEEKMFQSTFDTLGPDGADLDPFRANGSIVPDTNSVGAGLIAGALLEVDTETRAPLEPTWKNNVNPFFWVNAYKGTGRETYQSLLAHTPAEHRVCPLFPFIVLGASGTTKAAALNDQAIEMVFTTGDLEAAKKRLNLGIEASPKSGVMVYNWAILEASQYNLDGAVRLFDKSRTLDLPPEFSTAALGYAKELNKLIELLKMDGEQKTRIFRENMDAANVCFNAGIFKGAMNYASKAAVIDPQRPDPYILASRICELSNRSRDAFRWAQRAQEHTSKITHQATLQRIVDNLIAKLAGSG